MTLSLEDVVQDMRRLCPPVGDWVEAGGGREGHNSFLPCAAKPEAPRSEGTLCLNTRV